MATPSSLSVVLEELDDLRLPYRLIRNKHVKVWITVGEREHLFVCSQNGRGHHRAIENSRAQLRRLLRQLGALDGKANRG